jgi:YHS domain-containing protein
MPNQWCTRRILQFAMILALAGCGSAEDIKVQAISTNEDGIAIGGYGVVSYFDGQAQLGSADYSHEWNGATFRFASEPHRDTFVKNPTDFTPQYGGYCSFGMGFGKPVTADPKAFIVQDGKLHLNTSPMVLRFWRWFGNPKKSEAKWLVLKADAGIQ